MHSNRVQAIAGIAAVSLMVVILLRRRRRAASSTRVIATFPSAVTGRPWYREIIVTEAGGASELETLRSLHLGSAENVPESIVRMRREAVDGPWQPVAAELLKPHLQHSLLAFSFLPAGFPVESRAALMGVAAGSLLHFWRECVPGGRALRIDAVELDSAALDAARAHLGLGACEAPKTPPNAPGATFHVADGADFLRTAEDEEYVLLMVDLDMGSLVHKPAAEDGRGSSRGSGGGGGGADEAAAKSKQKARLPPPVDPTRDMYRVLREDGVLVINE